MARASTGSTPSHAVTVKTHGYSSLSSVQRQYSAMTHPLKFLPTPINAFDKDTDRQKCPPPEHPSAVCLFHSHTLVTPRTYKDVCVYCSAASISSTHKSQS